VTIMGLFLTPTFYVVLRGLGAWWRARRTSPGAVAPVPD
jgi:hypothetical protein